MFPILKSGLTNALSSVGISSKLHKVVSKTNVNKSQVATLVRLSYRNEDEEPLIKPFPYHEKIYSSLEGRKSFAWKPWHPNCKLIVVDGPVACGKKKFAQELAKELDFFYIPEPTFDDLYITHWGFDVRTLDSQLPKDAQTWDIDRFLQDPHDINTAAMQLYMYHLRLKSYIHAYLHLCHTGQGVITVRGPWSDRCFTTAMHDSKYISDGAYETIMNTYKNTWHLMFRPHLTIYMDVPVDVTLENIQKYGEPLEKTSKVFTKEYLTSFETDIKCSVLDYLEPHGLIYYHKNIDEPISDTLDEIEKLNFDNYLTRDFILSFWRMSRDDQIGSVHMYSNELDAILSSTDIYSDVPELHMSAESSKIWEKVWGEE
ncbi:PREDICTED: NADH dehydrogenase [ubiquinone] 1 alpha subcomplex subunit 10, mitochondrial [Ceratosolen solmsi marchali]|uniref:NADH dehydrogenase [ubiquinone] 1 alpha subcomplex subunit 10, mitochondrial n=1 Tax=Ceratosolen solmsi marchali TaxID=326594 RepID=A0AAJ6YKH1_9HYME|nr:PREDICTED: NADH dehydrogenase [ubiquinone] 1 alpha subcomplex subunit 10, mitochondrial [Ceratosolen solmsi marchali]